MAANSFGEGLGLRIEARLKAREAVIGSAVDDKEIHVSALEMRLLLNLLRAPSHMCTRRELLTDVWGYHPEVASRTVDTHIKRLRDKLDAAADLLQTVRGVGFRMADPVPRVSRVFANLSRVF